MKKFVLIFGFSVLFILGSIASFNYFIDPMWCFSHKNSFNQYQMTFNERQQKINTMHYQDFNYTALMLGSSRVAYINPHDIKSHKAFNLAVAHMQDFEYNPYLEYAKQKNGSDFDIVLLGLDFTSAVQRVPQKEISNYINIVNELGYRYKILLSLDTLKFSIKNFKNSALEKYKTRGRTCDRDYVTHAYKKSAQYVIDDINGYLFPHPYSYNEDYKQHLLELKHNNPNTKFLIFTTPISSKRFEYIFQDERNQKLYSRWLKESLEVFDTLEHFMYINSLTKDYPHTFNGVGHYYPHIGTKIINKVFDYPDNNKTYPDFGMQLNLDNLEENIHKIFSTIAKKPYE